MKKSFVAAICLIGGFAVNAQTNGKDAPVSNTPTTLATPVEISQDDVEEMQKNRHQSVQKCVREESTNGVYSLLSKGQKYCKSTRILPKR